MNPGDNDLALMLIKQIEFSASAFGPGKRTEGVLDHIRKELGEIEAKPEDLEEWIDLVILALDGAWRSGPHTPEQIIETLQYKYAKNRARTWPDWRTADPGKAIEHDRTKDTGSLDWIKSDVTPYTPAPTPTVFYCTCGHPGAGCMCR